jgi:hypothetical protein
MTDPEAAVRAFFDVFNEEAPERFDDVIADDYLGYRHEPAGVGPQGGHDDHENTLAHAGHMEYTIDALVVSEDRFATVWTSRRLEGEPMQDLSPYRIRDGKITETRRALIQSDVG